MLILLVQGCSPALNWRDVHPPNTEGLVLSFPCRPDVHQRTLELPGLRGDPVQMTVLACHANGSKWAIAYFDAATPERWLSAPALWQAALEANVGALAGGQSSSSRMDKDDKDQTRVQLGAGWVPGSTPHPHAARWLARGVRPVSLEVSEPVVVNAMYFSKGLRVYQLSWWRRDDTTSTEAWQTFANSAHFSP